MHFADYLPAARVRVGVQVEDKEALIDMLAGMLLDPDDPPGQRELIHQALVDRERLGSTGIGNGIAVPHGRSQTLDRPRAAFVQLSRPVDFNAADHTPVDLVAALIVPAHFTDEHLQLLAGLAEAFAEPEWCRELRDAHDVPTLLRQLREARPA